MIPMRLTPHNPIIISPENNTTASTGLIDKIIMAKNQPKAVRTDPTKFNVFIIFVIFKLTA